MKLQTAKKSTQPIITGLRPIRSATGANAKVPRMAPRPPAAKIKPEAPGFAARGALKLGATYPIAWVSKPSTNIAEAHIRRTPIWKRPIVCSSINAVIFTSPVTGVVAPWPIRLPPHHRQVYDELVRNCNPGNAGVQRKRPNARQPHEADRLHPCCRATFVLSARRGRGILRLSGFAKSRLRW